MDEAIRERLKLLIEDWRSNEYPNVDHEVMETYRSCADEVERIIKFSDT